MKRYADIPEELKRLSQWVCADEGSKTPMRAYDYTAASATNPKSWSDFDTALEAVEHGQYGYCGFVFADNGLVGIDIDAGYEDGLLSPLAVDIIGHCKSYTEVSKSRRGFHIIVKGDLPFKGKNNLAGVEIYKTARYFIMTGETLVYRDIIENQQAIDYVVDKFFPETRTATESKVSHSRIYAPLWDPFSGGKLKLRPKYPEVPEGGRNLSLTSLAGALRTHGYSRDQILKELIYANKTACKPPLSEVEVRSVVNSVMRYARN